MKNHKDHRERCFHHELFLYGISNATLCQTVYHIQYRYVLMVCHCVSERCGHSGKKGFYSFYHNTNI